MTDLALSPQSALDLSLPSFTLPSVSQIAETSALTALDTAGRVVNTVEHTIDGAAEVVNAAVPALTRFVGGFLLPEHANRIVGTATEYATRFATWFGVSGGKAAVQSLTFGAPAWAEAARQWVGVQAVASELKHGDRSEEFLARCFAEQNADPLIKESLIKYLDLRKELRSLSTSPEGHQERLGELSKGIANIEVTLREYQEFDQLKNILERGAEVVGEEHKKMTALAYQTADRIIAQVENYYKDKCGSFSGEIQGPWTSAATEEERAGKRQVLATQIAKRLQSVFERTLTDSETKAELDAITSDLHSAFSSYGKATKAALYTILGVGYATGAFRYIAEYAGSALKQTAGTAYNWIADRISSVAGSISDTVHNGINACREYLYNSVTGAVKHAVENNPVVSTISKGVDTVSTVAESVSNTASSVSSTIADTVDQANESVSDFFSSGAPNYSSPYWTKTNKVFMGYDADMKPIWGESCISGWPSRPRFDPEGLDFTSLKSAFENPRPDLDSMLLKPGNAPIDKEFGAELLKMLEKK